MLHTLTNRRNRQWIFLVLLWILGLVSGVIGFSQYAKLHTLAYDFWDKIYLTLQLISTDSGGLEPPVPPLLNFARFFILFLTAATAVKAFWELFHDWVFTSGLWHFSGHTIICGLSRKGFLLANSFRETNKRVVVIEKDENHPWIHTCRDSNIFVIVGDACEEAILLRAGIRHADSLFAVCDDDGTNITIALQAEKCLSGDPRSKLKCMVHIQDPRLCALLKNQLLKFQLSAFQIELFNVFERGAVQMLQTFPAWKNPSEPPGHIILVGVGKFGQNLLVHMGRSWWNLRQDTNLKLPLTIIDLHASQVMDTLHARYPQLKEAIDDQPLDMNIHSADFELADFLPQENISCIYICVDQDSLALEAGLDLQSATLSKVPVVLRMSDREGLARILDGHNSTGSNCLKPFFLLESTCTMELLKLLPRDILAEALHNEYLNTQLQSTSSSSSASLQSWENLSPELRQQNYALVDHQLMILSQFGYSLKTLDRWDAPSFQFSEVELDGMAKEEHKLWMSERLAEGWKYHPNPKNQTAKTNPNLVPWENLPEPEKEKNRTFFRTLPAFLGQIGLQLVLVGKNE